jgi:hypothetical protein
MMESAKFESSQQNLGAVILSRPANHPNLRSRERGVRDEDHLMGGTTELDVEELQEAAMAEEIVAQTGGGEADHGRPLVGLPATVSDLELKRGRAAPYRRGAADEVGLPLLGPSQVDADANGYVLREHSLVGPRCPAGSS